MLLPPITIFSVSNNDLLNIISLKFSILHNLKYIFGHIGQVSFSKPFGSSSLLTSVKLFKLVVASNEQNIGELKVY